MTQKLTPVAHTIKALASHIKLGLTGIAQVYEEWPASNVQISLPSITISPGSVKFTAIRPSFLSKDAPDVDNQSLVRYTVGQQEFNLQLDLWARNRPEREDFLERFTLVFNKDVYPMGLRLQLTSYFNQWVDLISLGVRRMDDETSRQRNEFRAMIDVSVIVMEVMEKTEYVITQNPAIQFETPATIED